MTTWAPLLRRFKALLVFYQVFAVRENVYGFSLPEKLSDWLSAFEVLSFDVGGFVVPSWSCVGGLTARLLFNALAPLVLMAALAIVLLAREVAQRGARIFPSLRIAARWRNDSWRQRSFRTKLY